MPPRRHPANPQIGRSIEAARKRAGLTQLDLVYLLRDVGIDTSVSTLQRWESTGSIKLDDAARLAVSLGITLDDLAAPVLDEISGSGDAPTPARGEQRIPPADRVDAMEEATRSSERLRPDSERRRRTRGTRRADS